MGYFKLDYYEASVKRLTYTTDTETWIKKSSYSVVSDLTAKGYLSPVWTNNQDVWLDRYWQQWNFECDYPFDVKETDILTIGWVDYQVKSFARVKGIKIDRMRFVLTLPKNQ